MSRKITGCHRVLAGGDPLDMSLGAVVGGKLTTESGNVQGGHGLTLLIMLNIATLETYDAEPVQMGCESTL